MSDDTSLPGWISWTSGGSHLSLSVNPADGSVKASNPWVIKVVYTPTNGSSNPTYNAVSITIECEVASFAVSGTPGTQAYTVFDAQTIFDLSAMVYTQSPACGYTFTSVYTYTTSPASSFVTAGTVLIPSVAIYSAAGADAGTVTVTVNNAITIDGSQGQTTAGITAATDTFDITLTNPCVTTTITDISFSPASMTVADGSTGTSTFTIPQDTVDSANTVQDLCGVKTYTIKDSGNSVISTWASIAEDPSDDRQRILTIDAAQYSYFSSVTTETITVETKYADWAGNAGNTAS
jgi:hypothetical protein